VVAHDLLRTSEPAERLEPEDLRALTLESSAITGLPLVGTRWVPGRGRDA